MSVRCVPAPMQPDRWHPLRGHQAAADALVPSHAPAETGEEHVSALEFKRHVGGVIYTTAWLVKHKIMDAMCLQESSSRGPPDPLKHDRGATLADAHTRRAYRPPVLSQSSTSSQTEAIHSSGAERKSYNAQLHLSLYRTAQFVFASRCFHDRKSTRFSMKTCAKQLQKLR